MANNKTAAAPQVDFSRLPRHVAIILDGNGRWAKKRGLPRTAGHAAGSEKIGDPVDHRQVRMAAGGVKSQQRGEDVIHRRGRHRRAHREGRAPG